MDGVEAVRSRHEVRRCLRRASDAGKLRDLLRLDVHLVERTDDLIADGVVTAAGAERRLAAVIIGRLQSDAILFRRLGSDFDYGFSHVVSMIRAAAWPPHSRLVLRHHL